ncbi:alpha/beta hydrolase [Amycolatopsis sp. FDAARGOS 1241]|uniref:alpha/beta hydrolase n=1 Tax=Amycolatopsis sp. FDAARGOS 1241 TaxID=2778070 RepID=UPI001950B162|nr:alpha/beta hydrolase [Amycolatopsis sp. FDAARGOS 1241]QRP50443.1 alpha/beta hydrolase [Amycolatopsis sp. FDAARGOS 1241]
MSVLSRRPVADIVARRFAAKINAAIHPASEPRFAEITISTRDISVETRHGPVDATIYFPPSPTGTPGVYVNAHGGGFVVGRREQDDAWCRFLAAHADVVVLNTDYALAPHNRFPTPVEQFYDVVRWASGPERDWDGTRLCVGGQSAGGNLSAAVSRMALENDGPAISLQVLHYPPLDIVTPPSRKRSPLGPKAVLQPWLCEVFDTAYVPDRARRRHRFVSPAWGDNAAGIEGIAPALVITAEFDRLRDEAKRYADKLEAAGALAEYIEVPGVDHGYDIMTNETEVIRRMYEAIAAHVGRAIG